jgi:hypothetical protein
MPDRIGDREASGLRTESPSSLHGGRLRKSAHLRNRVPKGKVEAVYANAHVAFGRDASAREGSELQSDRFGGDLPWFAKTGLFVRGTEPVVVRVPSTQRDAVKILGWTGTDDNELRGGVLVEPASACPADWTAYPGGLAFSGRRCVRLRVEGPGDETGSALFGLRKDCSR